jgi:DNA primase
MDISEQILQVEINKLIRKKAGKQGGTGSNTQSNTKVKPASNYPDGNEPYPSDLDLIPEEFLEKEQELVGEIIHEEEKELLRMMLQYGNVLLEVDAEDTDNVQQSFQLTVCEFVIFEMWRDELEFVSPIHQIIMDEFHHELEKGEIPTIKTFINSLNPIVSQFAIDIASSPYILSNQWEKFGVNVPQEIYAMKKGIEHQLFSLKSKRLDQIITDAQELLKVADPFENQNVFEFVVSLLNKKKRVNKILGRTVIR